MFQKENQWGYSMKKIFSLFSLFLLITGCSSIGKITVQKDDFKNAVTVSMKYKHSSVEKQGIFSGRFKSLTSYYREIKDNRKTPASASFMIDVKETFNTIKQDGFIRVNRQTFPLTITGISSELKTATDTTVSTKNNDTLTHSSLKTETETTTEIQTRRWKTLRGNAIIPLNVEEEILKAKVFAYRLYIDNKPVTFIVKRDDLKKIQEFLKTTSGKKK